MIPTPLGGRLRPRFRNDFVPRCFRFALRRGQCGTTPVFQPRMAWAGRSETERDVTQQQRVEEAWRTMKSGLKMRPVFHWAPHRIHAHIAITVLSLLLERTIEHACQDTWRNIRDDLKRIQLALLSSPNGRVWQVTEPSSDAAKRLKSLKIKPPKPILNLG